MRMIVGCLRNGSILGLAVLLNLGLLMLPLVVTGRGLEAVQQWPRLGLLLMAQLLLVVEAGSMRYAADRVPATSDRRNALAHILALASGVLLLMLLWSGLLSELIVSVPQASLGLALMAAGILLRGVAIHQLRERFVTSIRTDSRDSLRQEGIYAWVRHPSETGLLMFSLGAALCGGSLMAFALWTLGLAPVMLYRIGLEDECLREQHGEQFEHYRRRVGGLLPTLRR